MSQSIAVSSEERPLSQLSMPSTQEIQTAHTQEASNASDFFENLRDSQIVVSPDVSPASSQSNDVQPTIINGYIESKPFVVEKKKRGRKRKIRTQEELDQHLRDKKEKNRLAAQRLRKKKCQEVANNDKTLEQMESNVQQNRKLAHFMETKVNALKTKLHVIIDRENKAKTSPASSQQMPTKAFNGLSIGKSIGKSDSNASIGNNQVLVTKSEPNRGGKHLYR